QFVQPVGIGCLHPAAPAHSCKEHNTLYHRDLLFYTVAEGQETIPAHKFLTALKATGLRSGDPRLKECMETLKETLKKTSDGVTLDRHLFKKCVQSNIVLLTQAFRKKFVIPDFQSFTSHIDELYENAKNLTGGQVADYIPQLAKFNPDLWAVSLCTVDGQRHTVGDTKVPFCMQSCVKPLKYAVAVHDHSTEYVHSFIGKEPSGLRFNKLSLNEDDKPHNPMVNAGAIVCTSLIKVKAVTLCPPPLCVCVCLRPVCVSLPLKPQKIPCNVGVTELLYQ
uniref:glutaminase n=1 Tax=Neolamprologus brichardi TaxID=32507 RepID=A0A3Q4HKH8_NEOBR